MVHLKSIDHLNTVDRADLNFQSDQLMRAGFHVEFFNYSIRARCKPLVLLDTHVHLQCQLLLLLCFWQM